MTPGRACHLAGQMVRKLWPAQRHHDTSVDPYTSLITLLHDDPCFVCDMRPGTTAWDYGLSREGMERLKLGLGLSPLGEGRAEGGAPLGEGGEQGGSPLGEGGEQGGSPLGEGAEKGGRH